VFTRWKVTVPQFGFIHKDHNINPTVAQPSVCLIDGDSQQEESDADEIYRLPGQSPESYVYDSVLDKLD